MTLPLIYALQQASWLKKQEIIYIIRNQSHKSKKVAEVIEFVKASGGLEYATQRMNAFHEEAETLLQFWPESSYRKALSELLTFTITRQK